jgi:hypothetical protein
VSVAVGALNVLLGAIYFQYGTMTVLELRRNWRTLGFSHFGAAWIAMAFTCGPHHFFHGLHVLATGQDAGVLDLVAVSVGVPAGVTWFALRVEAFRGGAGDRFVAGNPVWLLALPTLGGAYLAALVAAMLQVGSPGLHDLVTVAPNLMLVVVYGLIGSYLIRTQLANRRPLGGWSLSGLALAVIFPTCAVMHGIFAFYVLSGRYVVVGHMAVIDWLAVPAGLYFLWVVQALYRGTFTDWNRAPGPARAVAT